MYKIELQLNYFDDRIYLLERQKEFVSTFQIYIISNSKKKKQEFQENKYQFKFHEN